MAEEGKKHDPRVMQTRFVKNICTYHTLVLTVETTVSVLRGLGFQVMTQNKSKT
jgi:hypothetical protein